MPINPAGADIHVNVPLTNVSVAWFQNQPWAAPTVFPNVPVQKQGDLYWKYDRGDFFQALAEVRAPATESVGGGWNVSQDSYYAKVWAVHQDLDDQTLANADAQFTVEADSARWVVQQLGLKREAQFVETFMAMNVWGDAAGSGDEDVAGAWATTTTDIVAAIRAKALDMETQTGFRPNTMVVDPPTYEAFFSNEDVLDRIKYTQAGVVGLDLIAALVDIPRVVTVRSHKAESAGSDTLAWSHGNKGKCLLTYSAPTPGLRTPSAGYIFSWAGLLGAGALGIATSRFRMEHIKSFRIEGEMAYDMKVVAPELGYLFNDTVIT
jgi:hypothetical protein